MFIPWDQTISLIPRSRSSVKVNVKYQGHIEKKKKKNEVAFVSQTHLGFYTPAKRMFSELYWNHFFCFNPTKFLKASVLIFRKTNRLFGKY